MQQLLADTPARGGARASSCWLTPQQEERNLLGSQQGLMTSLQNCVLNVELLLLHRPFIHPTCIAAWARSVLNVNVGRAEQPSTSVARLTASARRCARSQAAKCSGLLVGRQRQWSLIEPVTRSSMIHSYCPRYCWTVPPEKLKRLKFRSRCKSKISFLSNNNKISSR